MSDTEDLLDVEKDQSEIRRELSNMSFEELQKLKEKIGTKIYNATLFGPKKPKRLAAATASAATTSFKRENKNRPREESAKRPVPRFREVIPLKKEHPRDPRFDSLCGEFNEKAFKNSYSFLSEYRRNDLNRLKEQIKDEEDPKQIKKIKYLIQRLENQLREEDRKKEKEANEREEKQEIKNAIESGEKPVFKKKSEKRIESLVSQFEDLKNSGKLKKHIKRLRKKNEKKDRERLNNSFSE